MNIKSQKYYTQARASLLLGMPDAELDRNLEESGWGAENAPGDEKETYLPPRNCAVFARSGASHRDNQLMKIRGTLQAVFANLSLPRRISGTSFHSGRKNRCADHS